MKYVGQCGVYWGVLEEKPQDKNKAFLPETASNHDPLLVDLARPAYTETQRESLRSLPAQPGATCWTMESPAASCKTLAELECSNNYSNYSIPKDVAPAGLAVRRTAPGQSSVVFVFA